MSYTSVFGGNTLYPSDVSYLSVSLTTDIELEWPLESSGELPPAARIIDVTPNASGRSIVLPNATLTGAGQIILFNNISGSYNFYVKDFAGNTLATIASGEQWEVYLAATTTAAGTWRVFRFGASTASVQPSALAGYGLTVTDSTLSQSLPVTTFSTTGLTVSMANRASAFVWNATGAGTLNLLTAASAGNNFFVYVRNAGGGDLVIDPSGTELINGASTLTLTPGDSATLITDGAQWYTIGLGQQAVFAFDYTSISVTGGNYILAGSELNRIAYKFVGTLVSDLYVIVPATVQQYWITNATTGAFNMFVKTSTGTPLQINQGAKGIYYCDGTNMVLASDPTSLTTPIVVSDGGTGATTASAARLNLGITTFADAIVTATTGASVRTTINAASAGANSDITSLSGLTTPLSVVQGGTAATTASGARTSLGAAASGANSDITSLSGLTTPLSVGQGGTAATTASGARTSLGAAASGANNDITSLSGLTTPLSIAQGGTAATSASGARTSLGASTLGANIFTITNPSAVTFPRFNADNTISALDAATFRSAIGAGTGGGSVTSVDVSGGTTGLTTSGGPVTSSGTITIAGTLNVANGGTGATSASGARTNLGATTVGANFFTLTNPSAITFVRINADNTISALNAADFRTAIGASSGTVTSIDASGGTTGLTFSGGPVTSSGTLTLSGTLAVANGGTGATTASAARSNLGAAASGANTDITALDQDVTITATGTIAADTIGFRGLPQNSQTASYTLALADAGKHISNTTGGFVIPANSSVAFPVGTTIVLYNNSGSTQTISITSDTLRQAGTSNTGTRNLALYGLATCVKVASTTWVVSGNVS